LPGPLLPEPLVAKATPPRRLLPRPPERPDLHPVLGPNYALDHAAAPAAPGRSAAAVGRDPDSPAHLVLALRGGAARVRPVPRRRDCGPGRCPLLHRRRTVIGRHLASYLHAHPRARTARR